MTDTVDNIIDQALVDGYFACWNASDDEARAKAIEAVWDPDAHSVDPMSDVVGHTALAEMFAGFHATYPGSSFRQRGGIDRHHQLLRWGWEMIDPDGNVALDGIDVAVLNESGLIAHLAGFFGYALPDPT